MNSALAALIGLAIAIFLIIKKISPVYSLMLGALAGGLLSGWGMERTVAEMISGVKDISPAVVRIIAAGVLSGTLVMTGAAESIAKGIIKALGKRQAYLALALSTMILTAIGVFIDVAVITIAPIALIMGRQLGLSGGKLLIAMIGGGKCGNIMSPNPNTISAADNFDAPLSSVMGAGIIPALIGLIVTVFIVVPLFPDGDKSEAMAEPEADEADKHLPSFLSSIAGPLATILLLALRPLFHIVVDPAIALPAGGIVGILATRSWKKSGECLSYGLGKMSTVALLLIGTGTIAGIIKASDIKDIFVGVLSGWEGAGLLMAPLSGMLMCAATASTTAGATVASASFADTILAAGVSPVWGASMVNAGATVLDHLPHGSFFHATGGCMGMDVKKRLRLIPYESLIGITLTAGSVVCSLIF